MKRTTSLALGCLTSLALVGAATPAILSPAAADAPRPRAQAPTAFGLTAGGDLVRFRVNAPGTARTVGEVDGLVLDSRLVGLDFRPADGRLYGVGDRGGIYTIAPKTAEATQVSRLTAPLQGDFFGVDFNPAADRLRVVSDTGQNLRHDVSRGGTTTVDGTLNTPPSTDPTTGVTGAAYTNNDNDTATGTALFDINTALDTVALQVPANDGTLTPQGPLGVDARRDAGFDIVTVRRENTAFATLAVKGRYRLYKVSVLSGKARLVGAFPGGTRVVDIAVRPSV